MQELGSDYGQTKALPCWFRFPQLPSGDRWLIGDLAPAIRHLPQIPRIRHPFGVLLQSHMMETLEQRVHFQSCPSAPGPYHGLQRSASVCQWPTASSCLRRKAPPSPLGQQGAAHSAETLKVTGAMPPSVSVWWLDCVRALILIPSLPEGIHIRVPTTVRQLPTYRLLLVRAFSSGSCAHTVARKPRGTGPERRPGRSGNMTAVQQ